MYFRDETTAPVSSQPLPGFGLLNSQAQMATRLLVHEHSARASSHPKAKTPAYLTIGFAVDDVSFLWVNGVQIVKHTAYFTTGRFCVALESTNCGILLAINVTNTGGPAGLFADVVVTYTDGTTSQIVTDSSWRASVGNIPDGFQELSYDDSTWETVITQGGDGVAPWGRPQHAGTDLQSLATARWIWTNEAAPAHSLLALEHSALL
ncbi:hypothetical protein D9757_010085 [Collybiopsis confluens]|uniref:Uncharacterized protein n=1 Tax=Collybiopsis confluens TaxID=2823264 RepID=A0A8H5GM64_9AGAR|nr:hypothetical protein D9757_010085 [Collybiopsis confluens]